MRNYSKNTKKWKTSFEEFLKLREINNPARDSRMAIDVIISYETEKATELSFDDLTDVRQLRIILSYFKDPQTQVFNH